MPEQAKIDKLPKWAQTYIKCLERDKEDAERKMNDVLKTSDVNSNIILLKDIRGGEDIPLPKHSTVRFVIGEDRRDHVDCYILHDKLHVLRITASETIQMIPQACNSAHIELKK